MNPSSHRLAPDPEYGYLRVEPIPSIEEVEEYYLNEFYSGEYRQFNDSQLEVQQEQQEFFRLHWQLIHDECELLLGPLAGKALLDVGCGYCQSLLYFRERGLKVYGIEPSKEGAEYGSAHNIPVVQSGIETMPEDLGRRFEIVTLLNVLEHLRDPAKALMEIHDRYITPGGVLVIDVPNEFNDFQTTANAMHQLGEWWVCAPVHLNYFSLSSLTKLLDGCGYRVVHAEASFPLEMFMLWNDVYVGDSELGRKCHLKRVEFEMNLVRHGKLQKLKDFYAALAEVELGRQITVYAVPLEGGR